MYTNMAEKNVKRKKRDYYYILLSSQIPQHIYIPTLELTNVLFLFYPFAMFVWKCSSSYSPSAMPSSSASLLYGNVVELRFLCIFTYTQQLISEFVHILNIPIVRIYFRSNVETLRVLF